MIWLFYFSDWDKRVQKERKIRMKKGKIYTVHQLVFHFVYFIEWMGEEGLEGTGKNRKYLTWKTQTHKNTHKIAKFQDLDIQSEDIHRQRLNKDIVFVSTPFPADKHKQKNFTILQQYFVSYTKQTNNPHINSGWWWWGWEWYSMMIYPTYMEHGVVS